MHVLIYAIELEQPLLATSLLGDPNSTVSYSYIPGSALRGLFAGRFRSGAHGQDDAAFQRLFLSGQTRFLSAYPVAPDGRRCLPTPRSLQHEKQQAGAAQRTIVNRAIDYQDRPGRWKGLGQPFCDASAGTLHLVEPARTIAVHVQRDRAMGRAWLQRTADDQELRYGTVFRYEALAAGQRFMAAILIDTPGDEKLLDPLLAPATCWLGRSRSAGYGRVQIIPQPANLAWREAPGSPALAGDLWTLTCLSPMLLCSADAQLPEMLGEDAQSLDDATLSAYLGCRVEIEQAGTFTDTELVGGFNRHWGLPVPQRRALTMGSVVAFLILDGTLDHAAIEANGLGERRAEGFGRVAFNWLAAPTYQGLNAQAEIAQAPVAPPAQASVIPVGLRPLAIRVADRLFDARIDAAIISFVQRYVWPQVPDSPGPNDHLRDRMPTNSQLARLHTLVRQAAAAGDTRMVLLELGQLRATARLAYERAHMAEGKGTLASWIGALLTAPQTVWEELGYLRAVAIGDIWPRRDDQRTRRVALRLVAAVLNAPAQRRKGHAATPEEAPV